MLNLVADIGVPMLFPQTLLMFLALIPIVAVESWYLQRALPSKPRAFVVDVAIANTLTTAIGVPLAWFLMIGLEILTTNGTALGLDTPAKKLAAVTLQAAWLIPYDKELIWMVPAAATVLLIPCFFASVAIETLFLRWRWRAIDRKAVGAGVFRANLWSYLILFLIGSIWTMSSLTFVPSR